MIPNPEIRALAIIHGCSKIKNVDQKLSTTSPINVIIEFSSFFFICCLLFPDLIEEF